MYIHAMALREGFWGVLNGFQGRMVFFCMATMIYDICGWMDGANDVYVWAPMIIE